MAFGRLGWTPQEYYTSSPYEFFAACEGYFDKVDTQAMMHRAVATIVYKALGGSDNISKVWVIGEERFKEETTFTKLTPEEYEAILKAHKVK